MTEREYIDATNLAKIRCAKNSLHGILPMTPPEKEIWEAIMRYATAFEDRLTVIVKTKG